MQCAQYKEPKGFILLMTLGMIAVISLLVITGMQHFLVYYKALNKLELRHRNFYQLEEVARQLVKGKVEPKCFLFEDSIHKVKQLLLEQQGCSFVKDGNSYHYFIEDLGEFPCLVAFAKNKKLATHHSRISVLQTISHEESSSLLQIRYVTAIKSSHPCLSEEEVIPLGVSSWLYLAAL